MCIGTAAPEKQEVPPAPPAPRVTAERKLDLSTRRGGERTAQRSTVLTGPEGVQEEATVRRKTLLGV